MPPELGDDCPPPTRALPGTTQAVDYQPYDGNPVGSAGKTVVCERCGRRVRATSSGRPRVHRRPK